MMSNSKYLSVAYRLARNSRDNSNQNGAVLVSGLLEDTVVGQGNNNFAKGVEFTEQRSETRPDKYRYFEHAERNAIYHAAKHGYVVSGATMYCPWAACCDCARGIIQAGVVKLVMHKERMDMTPARWHDDVNEALRMLVEAGVVLEYAGGIIKAEPLLVNGELWSPSDPTPPKYDGNWFVEMGDLTPEDSEGTL